MSAFLAFDGCFRFPYARRADTGINDAGQVVGWSNRSAGGTFAFLWQNGTMTSLGALSGGIDSFATAINNAGQIVGYS